ncbi:hypothetical protein [Caldithrix abyssi]|uniref:Uncharacterized protein n=2 Tax=Caldithrix abyssi DSM 13497 TaxID=880073 RepID=A0A1J1CE42_CALAY|nr:hypothetical protein [Caldithrix abyssi]APF20838.1 hypothetical protein Cabys_4093 [Caldithrix abyssi DSM 13497]
MFVKIFDTTLKILMENKMNETLLSLISIIGGILGLLFQKNIVEQNIRAFSKKSKNKEEDKKIAKMRVLVISFILIIYGIINLIFK